MKNVLIFFLFLLLGGAAMIHFAPENDEDAILPSSPSRKHESFSIERAPSESLKGTIISLKGEVKWQSRIATQPASLMALREIQQGEEVRTGQDGNLKLVFKNAVDLDIFSDSRLTIIQTLPQNMVFSQSAGKIHYDIFGSVPVSIRSLHLLTQMNQGVLEITVDEGSSEVVVKVIEGSAQIAYNNADFISQVKRLEKNQALIFNDVEHEAVIQ